MNGIPHNIKDPEVLRLMSATGGSFVANLAIAWLHADSINNAKLFAAFGHYYRTYEAALRDEQERRNAKSEGIRGLNHG